MNRLSNEKSPYLLQHKDNPVDWYPWCAEAFDKARAEDKPIFLSIGYSTCHWCHVMAHESFEDSMVAKLLNDGFVCIKVDREERPDIDAVYMKACQTMTGSGGWPMTVLMTPEQKPFFAGTYFPKHSRYGSFGLTELLNSVTELWKNDREGIERAGRELSTAISQKTEKSAVPEERLLDKAYKSLERSFDPKWGGFGSAPKFPTPHVLMFLMRRGDTLMTETTLTAMARGGIFDHIGGGFSRYSTDEKWLKPHFEKMLYDNALLIIAYSEAAERLQNRSFAAVAKRTADYIVRELKSPEGGCFCGQDADSEGVEGKFYTFTPAEIRSVLGDEDGEEFCRVCGITEKLGIPNLIGSDIGEPSGELTRTLYNYRRQRTQLHTDDKILLSWNAWTVIAFVKCGYLGEAMEIQRFIEDKLTDANNRLYLRYRDGESAFSGQLDDYAVYGLALLSLYRATFEVGYLEQAILRAGQMHELFADKDGGYYLTGSDAEKLITRPKESYDGAMPSGNSAAAMLLEKLAQLTGKKHWRDLADRQMRYIAGQAEEYPSGFCFGLLAADKALRPDDMLVVCANTLPPELKRLCRRDLNILYKSDENAEALARCAPFTGSYPVPDGKASWYLCRDGACSMAVTDPNELDI